LVYSDKFIKNYHSSLSSLQLVHLKNIFLQNIDLCDYSVLPEPILALTWIIQNEQSDIDLVDAIEFSEAALNSEFSGEIYFYSTIAACSSLLLSMMKYKGECFDYLNLVLSILPIRGDEIEAKFIYSTLIEFQEEGRITESTEILRQAFENALLIEKELDTSLTQILNSAIQQLSSH
jgi:hypothetical protein